MTKMKHEGVIYKYTNVLNGKVYIGKTINEEHRKVEHRNSKKIDHFHNAIRKYGFDKFKYEVIFRLKSHDKKRLNCVLNLMEKFYIRRYNSYYKGYNSTLGGDGNQLEKLPKEWKEKISKSLIGNTRRRGKSFTNEQLKKLKGRKRPIVTDEMRKNIKERLYKTVYQFSLDGKLIAKYNSVIEAASINKLPKSSVAQACRRQKHTYKGYKWCYAQNSIENNNETKDNND